MIFTEIREKLKTAMKEKDHVALDTFRSALSAFTSELVASGKTPQDEVPDELAQKVIQKLIKQRRDAIEQYIAGGRSDLADNESAQVQLLERFLPAQLSDEEILKIALHKKAELNITDKAKIGILTGAIMKEVVGRADGSRVKVIVEDLL